ncbi:hypothetical protein C7I87_14790 [Mesorhizobium sp. SARCC-RB16n]|uniref:hypothetical protein n=1 Tax=Mesorhizobium sp. SARCC-RB16n TaxID=2116687 RepID=UPI00122F881C|nr:hypothetical protein [Mesorhizobium sp. SARCC-RB16n]KAA3449885.1 hypothetical protein C7I87_14790 [Mesorhizobium sp. SARCC-RB16n]
MIGSLLIIALWLAPSAYVTYHKGLKSSFLFIPISLFVGIVAFFGSAFIAQQLGATGVVIPLCMLLGGVAANAVHVWIEMGIR